MVRVWSALWKVRFWITGAAALAVFFGWISLVRPVHIVETWMGLGLSFAASGGTYLWLWSKKRRAHQPRPSRATL